MREDCDHPFMREDMAAEPMVKRFDICANIQRSRRDNLPFEEPS
jgi:hypothetical protein